MRKRATTTLPTLLESFFRQRLAAQRRASPATIATYRDALRLFLLFASERIGKPPSRLSLEALDRDLVVAFLDHLETERGNSVRTRNARLAAIHAFFQHLAYLDPALAGHVERVLAIPGKRVSKLVMEYLRRDELEALLATPDHSTPQGRRDHALLLFMVRTGARVSETVGVNVADVRLDRPWQVLLRGKGMKERVVPLSQDVVTTLRCLLEERGNGSTTDGPVFVNANKRRLSRYGVNHILSRVVSTASGRLPTLARRRVTPHTLRHTTAMHLLQAGVDLTTIQSWLGHAGVNTTHGYVEADLEMKRRALEKCELPESEFVPYQPKDEVLALLESL